MRQLGTIKCLEVNNDDNAPWIILFHGYGANAEDLFSLSEVIPVQKKVNWLFPDGFLEVPIGPGWTGRAWWNVNMLELQELAQSGGIRDLSDKTPVGLDKAVEKTSKMIEQLKIPWSQIIIGGFSQGALLATELYLNAPESPKGLIVLSGNALHLDKWKPLVQSRKGQLFFMSHGDNDPVLSIKGARKLETALTQNGMKGRLVNFSGGHEIPMNIIKSVGDYINNLIQ